MQKSSDLITDGDDLIPIDREILWHIYEIAPNGIVILTPDAVLVHVNPAFCDLVGYTAEELIGRSIMQITHRDDVASNEEQDQHLLPGNLSQIQLKQHFIHKDGRSIYVFLQVSPVRDSAGARLYLIGQTLDITAQLEAEQGQRESHSRLNSIFDAAMDAIITINEDQIVTMFNPAAAQMFGFTAADIIGRPLNQLIPEESRRAHADHVRAFGQTNITGRRMAALGSLWGRRANGEEFPIEVAISQVTISGQKLYTAIARDITERRKADTMLRESEEKFRSITEQSPNMIFISQNGRIVFINQQATEIMGYSQEEFFSSDIAVLSFVAADSIELVQSNFTRLMRGEKIPTHEYTLLSPKPRREWKRSSP